MNSSELPPSKRPSIFLWCIIGYLAAVSLSSVVCWISFATRSIIFDNRLAFKVFFFAGALGALIGYEFAVWRRKRMGVDQPSDQWTQFTTSRPFILLVVIVLLGSFVISLGEALLFDLVYGAPWLEKGK